jgi:predicted transcriptional regulator
MDKGFFREIAPEKDLTENEKFSNATYEMVKFLAGSPYRRMILISLLGGEKNIPDIKKDIRQMSSCEPKGTNKAFELLERSGFIEKSLGNLRLTDRGKNMAEIFRISLKIYGNGKGTA